MLRMFGLSLNAECSAFTELQSAVPAARREFFTSVLQDTARPVGEQESAFLGRWDSMLPVDRWGPWSISWLRALSSYGTPPNFVDGMEVRLHQFRELGMNWLSMTREGSNYEMRRALMAADITGTVFHDLTDDNIDVADPRLAAVAVALFRDCGNATYESGAGTSAAGDDA